MLAKIKTTIGNRYVRLLTQTKKSFVIVSYVIVIMLIIVTAQVPKALLPHSPALQSTVTEVMCQKSDLHVPFYRQEHEWEQKGCPLPRETAANWYNTCALEYLLLVYEALHSQFVHREIIHMDETTC